MEGDRAEDGMAERMMEDIALNEETKWLTEGNPAYRKFYTTETYDLNIFDDELRPPRMSDFQEDRFIVDLGMRGSGKSNTGGVLMEEFLIKKMPIVVVDIKNEYYTLRERYPITVIGEFEHYDERLSQNDPKSLAGRVINGKESVVLSFFQVPKVKLFKFAIDFFQELYELEKKARYPIMIFVEEAQVFVPQNFPVENKNEMKQLKEIMKDIALMGRSIGLGACFITQRSQQIDKSIITQAEHMFLHKVVHYRDQDIYKELIPFDAREVVYVVPKLMRGKCVYVHNGEAAIRQVRKKYSRDVASAPSYEKILKNEQEKYAESLREEAVENGEGEVDEIEDVLFRGIEVKP